jgi:hypothetical protein
MRLPSLVLLAGASLALWGLPVSILRAHEIVQHFPANKPAKEMQTSWRVVWDVTRHAGGSEILYVKEAYFKRGPQEAEIKILGDCRLSDTFVPYNNGTRIYDVSNYQFTLEDVETKELGPACITTPRIFDRQGKEAPKGVAALEVHDNHLRWKNSSGQSRRGQEMQLWSVLDAANYRYIIQYAFRDDGQVSFRLGATAHNLFSEGTDATTHCHSGCWRINVELGNADQTEVLVLRNVSKPGSQPKLLVEPFNGGNEGGLKWNPSEFTRLVIQSKVHSNGHQPPKKIAYELLSVRHGNLRLYGEGEEFTKYDFWVTRANLKKAELRYRDVPSYVNGETLAGAVVLWHQTPLLHTPRDEDFGADGYDANKGVALTSWTGFDLRPRNFFARTPLYP